MEPFLTADFIFTGAIVAWACFLLWKNEIKGKRR